MADLQDSPLTAAVERRIDLSSKVHDMKPQTVGVFVAGLLPLVLMAAGCGGTSSKQVGMIVTYEVDTDLVPPGFELSDKGMRPLMTAIEGRLILSGRASGRVRQLNDGRIEVSIFRAKPDVMQRIADRLPRPGTLEFRILANERDHRMLVDRAKAAPESERLRDDTGELLAWWVPVQEAAEKQISVSMAVATRAITKGDREVLEVLVVKDPFNVTGSFLTRAAVDKDDVAGPCISFTLSSSGGQLMGALTESNLPDSASGGFWRSLGIILDGELRSAPMIQGRVSKRGLITGNFTPEEVQDVVDLLNAGSLPVAIRKVEQRVVDVEQHASP